MTIRFGLGVPTATEGTMYPVPYADAPTAVRLAVEAERLGFESVWGNDHATTQRYVRDEFDAAPRFWDPFAYLAYVAAVTERVRLATAVAVMPFRHPALVAKQAATVDHLSGGRMVLGVGIGAYREEYEALYPGASLHRGAHAAEYVDALALLFAERRTSYRGRHVSFEDVESSPRPLQDPLPILSGGNSRGARQRAAKVHGWLPACLTPSEYRSGLAEIVEAADGNLYPAFEPALQLVACIGDTREQAVERFVSSQLHSHLVSLASSTLAGRIDDLEERNLIGTADDVSARVADYVSAGVGTFAGLLFAADTVAETLEQMAAFADGVIAPLAGDA